jgi:Alginate lyase
MVLAGLALAAVVFVVAGPLSTRNGDPGASLPPTPTVPASTSLALGQGGYFATASEIHERAERAAMGQEPFSSAIERLLVEADRAIEQEARPSDPITHRRGQFLEDSRNAYTLALASVVTQRDDYARASGAIIMAWVDGTTRTEDACPDRGGRDCTTSLLLSRNAPAFVFAADLISDAGGLIDDEVRRFQTWLANVILPAASERTNNWGDAGTFMRLVVADYLGDDRAFMDAVDDWRRMMDLVTADGEIPEETRRGKLGLLYTQGAISYKAAAAAIAERRGIDLWGYEGAQGGTLRRATETFTRYFADPDAWPWSDRPQDIPTVDPIWEILYQKWGEPSIASILAEARPLGSENPSAVIWTTVTNGEPITDRAG